MFFIFPEDARWDDAGQAVEFGVEIGEYRGVVRVPRRVFQRLLLERPPQRCVEASYLQRTRFERIAERRLWWCQVTEAGLQPERCRVSPRAPHPALSLRAAARFRLSRREAEFFSTAAELTEPRQLSFSR